VAKETHELIARTLSKWDEGEPGTDLKSGKKNQDKPWFEASKNI